MSKIDQLVKTIVKAIDEKDRKKTSALDTVATVSRIDGDTAWVKFAGSDSETPVKQTIAVKKGDKVQVRASKGSAWITGNITSPPTDNTLAEEAVKKSDTATKRAKRAEDMSIVADVMYYLASDQDEGVTTEDEGWTQEPQEATESLPYLWAYHDYERGNGKHFKSEPIIIAMYAEDGKGIDTLTTYYALGTSTSIAPTTGWATSFTYLSGYYIWRKELITYDDGTTKWTTAVYDAGLTQSSSLSYDTAQYIWTQPAASATTNVPSGQYVTEVDKDSYRNNPTGGALLLRSAGLFLRYAAKTLVELVAAGLKIYEPNDTTNPVAQFLSSGAIIGKENTGHITLDSDSLDFYSDSTSKPFAIDFYSGSYNQGKVISSTTGGSEASTTYYAASGVGRVTVYAEGSGGSGHTTVYIQNNGVHILGDVKVGTVGVSSQLYNANIAGTLTAGNIDHGSVSIKPTANKPTSKTVSFGKTFSSTPNVIISAETSGPGTAVLECSATNISTTGFTAWVYRTDTVATVLHWIAIS